MNCEQARILLSGLIDGELDPEEKKIAGEHIASCPDCRKEYARLKNFKEVTDDMKYFDLPDKLWAGYRREIYNRVERGIGWILLSIGAMILLAFRLHISVSENFIAAIAVSSVIESRCCLSGAIFVFSE